MTKIVVIILLILIGIFQYKLWFDKDSLSKTYFLHQIIAAQEKQNSDIQKHNNELKADIAALKQGVNQASTENSAIEDHARNDLGMIKKDEVFYQIVK